MVKAHEERYDPGRYISKERIYALMGLVLTGSVIISSGIMYVGRAVFYPLDQGIRLEARVNNLIERTTELRDTQKQILSTVQQNTGILMSVRRDLEIVNRYGSDALRRKKHAIPPPDQPF